MIVPTKTGRDWLQWFWHEFFYSIRRSGEAAHMKLSDYISRPSWVEQYTEEMKLSLSPIERKLAETFTIVEIDGKRGRKIPVILSPDYS